MFSARIRAIQQWAVSKLYLLLLGFLVVSMTACSPFRLINHLSPSDHYRIEADIAYGDAARQALDLYTPRTTNGAAPVVIFFYGGGWRRGAKQNYEFVASSLTQAGYAVAIPDYRLFPDVVFPAFVEDGALAVAWILKNVRNHGGDPDRVFLMGHSAGAHIATLIGLDGRYLAEHGVDVGNIDGLIGLSGPYDFLPIESGYLLDVFPEEHRAASQPVNFVSATAPPALLIHGSDDGVVKAANSERLAAQLSRNGVGVRLRVYDGAGHAVIAAALAPALEFMGDTLEDSRNFLDALSAVPEIAHPTGLALAERRARVQAL